MPVGSTVSYPVDVPDLSYLDTSMILDDSFVIRNIARQTTIEITLAAANKRMRPTPPRRRDMPTKRTYIAQDICNKDEFEAFYYARLGKSIKMDFEGYIYYGYLSDMNVGEFDITFSFTHTSKIPQIEGDDRYLSR